MKIIVKPDATQEEVDAIIDSDGPPQIFAQSVSNPVFFFYSQRLKRNFIVNDRR
jgi:hypothetical protein